jgi:hypothetical protein
MLIMTAVNKFADRVRDCMPVFLKTGDFRQVA